jgi:hypothetical protein
MGKRQSLMVSTLKAGLFSAKTLFLLLLASTLLVACAEPDRRVTRADADGLFSLSLEADENRVRPGGSLPVLVTLEYLGPPLAEERVEEIDLVANNGTVSEDNLLAIFSPAPSGAQSTAPAPFRQWVVFDASSRLLPIEQGEVRALWGTVQAVLKIRIAADPAEVAD